QSGSTGLPRDADLVEQLKRPVTALAAAFSFAASHPLGASGRMAASCDTQESTRLSHAAAELPHSPAIANAIAYLDSALALQSFRPVVSPVCATFERHASLLLSFLPIAVSFAATHLSQSAMARRQIDCWSWVNQRLPSGPFVMSPPEMVNSTIGLGSFGEMRP